MTEAADDAALSRAERALIRPPSREAVTLVRSVTTDWDICIHNGASMVHIPTYATNPVRAGGSSASPAVEYWSIGFGAGLGLGLALASALAALPARRRESAVS